VIPAFESIQWDFASAMHYSDMPAMYEHEPSRSQGLPHSSGVFELAAVLVGVSQFGAVDVQDYAINLYVGLFSETWQPPTTGGPPEPVYTQIGPWSTPAWDIAERIVLTVGQGTAYPIPDVPGLALGLRLGRTPNLKYLYSSGAAQVFPAPGREF
jgi:hypothetical protein